MNSYYLLTSTGDDGIVSIMAFSGVHPKTFEKLLQICIWHSIAD